MAISTRDIKRRIRSITNTRKITKAMELVASAKMRRTVQAVLATRPYTDRAWDLLLDLARRTDPQGHPLLRHRPVKKIAIVLAASNRGLVGAFNVNLINATLRTLARWSEPKPAVDFVLLGAKGRAIYTQHGQTVAAEFPKPEVVTSTRDISAMSKLIIDGYTRGDYDRVIVAFMDFESTLKQRPRLRQILPLGAEEFASGAVGLTSNEEAAAAQAEQPEGAEFEYLFEPDPEIVLATLLPRLVTMQLYRAVLETNASEQAARMMAMRNASDAADDLIDDLTLSFNQARQASITQDLSEISAGRAALEN